MFTATMESPASWLAACCLLLVLVSGKAMDIDNVDRLEPIVRFSPAATTEADQFGFAAVLHQVQPVPSEDSANEAAAKTLVLVGAPQGDFPGGTGLSPLTAPNPNDGTQKFTGLVYRCPVSPGTCGPIGNGSLPVFDGTGDERVSQGEGRAPETVEDKADQLMGQTLFSDGDTFIACAPRWIRNQRGDILDRQPRGRCFFSGRDLSSFTRVYPCDKTTGNAETTLGENYCTTGTGVTTINPMTHGFNMSIGSPGIDSFAGTVFHVGTAGVMQGFVETATDLHQGFQVTTGHILDDRSSMTPDVLATVPRYNGSTYAGRVHVINLENIAVASMSFDGDQIGSFFGHSIATADLNGDGFDDVIVGAPMYTDFGNGLVERGRVYLFENQAGIINATSVTLDGRTARGRFGFSVVNLGDIDNDDRDDFAVGAPYTDSDSSPSYGSIFVYYGRDDFSTIEATKREVKASDIVSKVSSLSCLRTFGFSLSSGVDIDNNKFNDLVVGAVESKAVIVLRTLPVVDVTIELFSDSNQIYLRRESLMQRTCELSGISYPCFNLTVTGNYTGRGVSGPLTIPYQIADISSVPVTQEGRLFFENKVATFSGSLTFENPGQESSDSMRVFARQHVFDRAAPYMLEITLSPIERTDGMTTGNETLSDFSAFPQFRTVGVTRTQVNIINNCGPNEFCEADLELSYLRERYRDEDGNELENFVAGGAYSIEYDFMLVNLANEDGINPSLVFSLPSQFDSHVVISSGTPTTFKCTTGVKREISCTLQDALLTTDIVFITLIVTINQDQVFGDLGTLTFDLRVQVDPSFGSDTNTSNDVLTLKTNVTAAADLIVELQFSADQLSHAETPPPSGETGFDRIGATFISLTATISNDGNTTIQLANLDIYFPARASTTEPNFFLYPTNIKSLSSEVVCGIEDLDPLDLSSQRRRHAVSLRGAAVRELWVRSKRQMNDAMPETKSFTCAGANPSCLKLSCRIGSISRGRSYAISVISYIDERFFAGREEVYSLTAFANGSIIDTALLPENPGVAPNQATASLLIVPPEATVTTNDRKLVIHAIIWPTVGALILILLLSIALYFCGFFRRKQPDGEAEQFDLPTPPSSPDLDGSTVPYVETIPDTETEAEDSQGATNL